MRIGLEQSHLLRRGFALVFLLPVRVRLAVHNLERLVVVHAQTALARAAQVPLGQAVPTKPRQIHLVDVLHIRAGLEVRHKLPERVRLELGLRARRDTHGARAVSRRRGASGWGARRTSDGAHREGCFLSRAAFLSGTRSTSAGFAAEESEEGGLKVVGAREATHTLLRSRGRDAAFRATRAPRHRRARWMSPRASCSSAPPGRVSPRS